MQRASFLFAGVVRGNQPGKIVVYSMLNWPIRMYAGACRAKIMFAALLFVLLIVDIRKGGFQQP